MKTYEVYIPGSTSPRFVDADRHVLLGDPELLYLYDEEGETICVFREWIWFRIQRDAKAAEPEKYDQSGFRIGGSSMGIIERPFA